jgi:hypothetical protein
MQSTTHVYEVCPRKDKRGADLISDVASSMRSQRSALVCAAQSKRIEEGNCGKQIDQSDDNCNLSKTEHPAHKHSKSGTHCYLRQGTESQSYKQIGPNPFLGSERAALLFGNCDGDRLAHLDWISERAKNQN